jgi:hypothetical protein
MSAEHPFAFSATLESGFQFSQSSLQDYVDCRRRFQLRYLLQLAWPALESEPALENERFVRQGELFHRLVHQHLVGVPPDRLRSSIQDDQLRGWFESFLDFASQAHLGDFAHLRPEKSVVAPLGEHRLIAKYDLLAWQDNGRYLLYDWKTSLRQPARNWLKERLQTRLYPCLLAMAGSEFNDGNDIQPSSIEMVYWYAAAPLDPVRFPYSHSQLQADKAFLSKLIDEIARLPADQFTLTTQEKRCAYCVYRSLCGRGEQAGAGADRDSEVADEGYDLSGFDFEQIGEIAF